MRLLLILISLVLISCSRRTVELERHTSDQRLKKISDSSYQIKLSTKSAGTKVAITDHRYGYRLTIEPEGEFTFDKNGFKGKAKSVIAEGSGILLQNIAETATNETDSTASLKVKKRTDSISKEINFKKNTDASGPGWIGWILPVIMVAIVMYFILKAVWPRLNF